MSEHPNLPVDGETALAAPIGEEFVLVMGVADAMPGALQVLLNGDPAMCMEATVVTWRRAEAPAEAAIGFVAAVPLQITGRLRLGSIVMRRGGRPARYTLVRRALPLQGLLHLMATDAGEAFKDAADGLIHALMSGKSGPKRLAAALTMLQAAARNDGFVEVMGTLDTGEVFLQGWSTELPADTTRLLVAHDGFLVGEFTAATVPREDLGGRGHGFFGLLSPGKTVVDPEKLQRLYFRGAEGWRALEIYERRVLLASTDVPAHIRDVLPRGDAGTETLRILRRASERFDGRDTVSPLQKPIRIGMDMVVDVPGGGILVSGWMLDPDGLVDSMALRAGAGAQPVTENWTRLPRPDVTSAFLNDPLFAGRLDPARHDHGFLAFVPGLSAADGAPVYFELTIEDDTIAFYPLTAMRGLSRRVIERLVSALDPRTATAALAIERHIGPMMQAVDQPPPRTVETRDFGFDDEEAPLALVVAAGLDAEEVTAALSLLALDPETRAVPIIVSAPVEAFDRVAAEVCRLAGFYGLGVRLVVAEGVTDVCDAFEAALGATTAETLVFLAAGVLPRRAGWLSRMERAYRARGGKVLVSPTIVFEDNSIRFAGTWLETEGGERRLTDRFIGYPRDVVRDAEPTEVVAGSVACCVVPRAAVETAGGFSRSYLGAADKGRDLCLKLKLAGTPSLWLPEVEMVAADEEAGAASLAWRRLAQRVDRWSFNRRWSLLVANMRG
ncbi:hypothetical protein QNA08_17345 [Chelatococcus sp. SYSU_G07232]|uniref:Uncharacterized protein n=1 Tax=Chelatococcus albus TaxID=3047466 RepID=A0ABT7AKS9_9HYPH|nr:hypothetical protein [Chelatococcus sp. SYSU_G07232]MDJ1159981.1 hypothetical protein [Chelatococcus sp. SYSU_G07232]